MRVVDLLASTRTVKASVADTAHAIATMKQRDRVRAIRSVRPDEGGCLTSTLNAEGRNPSGGPQVWWMGDNGVRYAMYHWRVYLFLVEGTIPALWSRRLTCGNPSCVNPEHRS